MPDCLWDGYDTPPVLGQFEECLQVLLYALSAVRDLAARSSSPQRMMKIQACSLQPDNIDLLQKAGRVRKQVAVDSSLLAVAQCAGVIMLA